MTPFEQRVAIARACGYELLADDSAPRTFRIRNVSDNIHFGWSDSEAEAWSACPDYLNDLNAMHEAEKTLTDDQWLQYDEHLACLTVTDASQVFKHTHATASQRAEAFLRALNLWTDPA